MAPVRRVEAICARHGVPPGRGRAPVLDARPAGDGDDLRGLRPERVEETLEWAAWPVPEAVWDGAAALPYATDDPEATRDYKLG